MKKKILICLMASMILLAASVQVQVGYAQDDDPELRLRMRRDFGYGGMGNDIEGLFTIVADGPANLARVTFLIDGEVMADVTEPPFNHQFRTGEYPTGLHYLTAIGYTDDGRELSSNRLTRNFVPAETGQRAVAWIIGIVLGGTVLVTLISAGIPLLLGKKRGGNPIPLNEQKYGVSGGAICSKCKKPFPMSFLGLNLIGGKLQRCPHCGSWVFARRARQDQLDAAAAAFISADTQDSLQPRQPGDLDRELDESRYMDD
jgi:DNA-directed RNA polymerase subunit RPC12/RpoP